MKKWAVHVEYIQDWLDSLPDNQYEDVLTAVKRLEESGPMLGRPFVDRISGSRFHNLKELRPSGSARYIRILFIFDPVQQAVFLTAGNKEGQWKKWYRVNIPRAEALYEEHLRQAGKEG